MKSQRMSYLIIVVVVQAFGLCAFGLSDWANIIQVVSGFALYHYLFSHRKTIRRLEQRIEHLHTRLGEEGGQKNVTSNRRKQP